ncbi:hypothetical protein [Cellulomonas sp. URHB0016]
MTQITTDCTLDAHAENVAAASALRVGGPRDTAAHTTGGAETSMAAVSHNSLHSVPGDSWAIHTAKEKPATPAVVQAHQRITIPREPSAAHVLHLTGAAS